MASVCGPGSEFGDTFGAAELQRNDLPTAGGAWYLHTLPANVQIAANAGYYGEIVRKKATLRRLIDAGTKLVQIGYEGPGRRGGRPGLGRGLQASPVSCEGNESRYLSLPVAKAQGVGMSEPPGGNNATRNGITGTRTKAETNRVLTGTVVPEKAILLSDIMDAVVDWTGSLDPVGTYLFPVGNPPGRRFVDIARPIREDSRANGANRAEIFSAHPVPLCSCRPGAHLAISLESRSPGRCRRTAVGAQHPSCPQASYPQGLWITDFHPCDSRAHTVAPRPTGPLGTGSVGVTCKSSPATESGADLVSARRSTQVPPPPPPIRTSRGGPTICPTPHHPCLSTSLSPRLPRPMASAPGRAGA